MPILAFLHHLHVFCFVEHLNLDFDSSLKRMYRLDKIMGLIILQM
jgi:hypothetical protein